MQQTGVKLNDNIKQITYSAMFDFNLTTTSNETTLTITEMSGLKQFLFEISVCYGRQL